MSKYNIGILKGYNERLKSPLIESKIAYIKKWLADPLGLDELVRLDLVMMEKVFDIEIPAQGLLDKVLSFTLGAPLKGGIDSDSIHKISKVFSYHEKIKPYMQFYYTIFELYNAGKLTDKNQEYIYLDWMDRLNDSDVYNMYINYSEQVERCIRWVYTLEAHGLRNF